MDYKTAMTYIKEVEKRGSVYGLEPMRQLLKELGNPESRLTFIHVGGTNGKGSVSAFITSTLAVNGKKTGRYISPTVFSYQEKIQYTSGNKTHFMTEEETVWSVERVSAAVQRMTEKGLEEPTVFEIETAMAFLLFEKWEVDIVVLEVGLGGTSDATNVVKNVCATVITPISMDHVRLLGDSIEKIAGQKAGIIKEGHQVFTIQEDEKVLEVLKKRCHEKNAYLHIVSETDFYVEHASASGTCFSYQGQEYRTKMAGIYQVENAALAIEVCRYMELKAIEKGILQAVWPGRFEVVSENPLVIIDGAHNKAGAEALKKSIEQLLPDKKIYGIYGVFADKEYVSIASLIVPFLEEVVTIQGKGERGLPAEKLAGVCQAYCDRVDTADSAGEAFYKLKEKAESEDVILAFGSLSFLQSVKEAALADGTKG